MISRRLLLAFVTLVGTSSAFVLAACSSSDSGTGGGTGNGTGGGTGGGKDSGVAAEDSSTAADTGAGGDSGIAPGSVGLAEGPCEEDKDCATSPRGETACFIGGMGGGGGDGGGASSSYCSLKCTPVGVANTTTCAAPFLEFCNMRGYCKLH